MPGSETWTPPWTGSRASRGREIVVLALDLGIERRLRGADAVYAATAAHVGGRLITWDRELLERADARTPSAWSDAQA
jgi:predicted nucleic acid-binding protein